MSTENNFEEQLAVLSRYSRDVGDIVEEEDIPRLLSGVFGEEEFTLTGHRCRRGDQIYGIAGHPELRFISIIYVLNINTNIGLSLDEEEAKQLVEDYADKDELWLKAGEVILDNIDRSAMEAFKNYLFMFGSTVGSEVQLNTNDKGSVVGFVASRKIFPYEDNFGIDKFDDAVVSVINAGSRVNRLAARTILVEFDEENPEESSAQLNFGW